jgi:hypothetical protein
VAEAEAEAGDGVEARWGVYGIPPREETTVGVGLNSVDSSSKATIVGTAITVPIPTIYRATRLRWVC